MEVEPSAPAIRKRRRLVAMLMSAAVPGFGQLFLGEARRGITILMIAAFMLPFSVYSYERLSALEMLPQQGGVFAVMIAALAPYLAIWAYAVIDAAILRE